MSETSMEILTGAQDLCPERGTGPLKHGKLAQPKTSKTPSKLVHLVIGRNPDSRKPKKGASERPGSMESAGFGRT
jgi:hypothetical protein